MTQMSHVCLASECTTKICSSVELVEREFAIGGTFVTLGCVV